MGTEAANAAFSAYVGIKPEKKSKAKAEPAEAEPEAE